MDGIVVCVETQHIQKIIWTHSLPLLATFSPLGLYLIARSKPFYLMYFGRRMLKYALDPDLASKINPAIHFLRFANMVAEDSDDVRRSLIDAGALFLLVSIVDLLTCTRGLVFH